MCDSRLLPYNVRTKYFTEVTNLDLKSLFWDGFYDYCAERQDFVSAYADPSGRAENNGWYATFGLGMRGVHATAYFAQRDGWVGVNICGLRMRCCMRGLSRIVRKPRRCLPTLAERFLGASRARRRASFRCDWIRT